MSKLIQSLHKLFQEKNHIVKTENCTKECTGGKACKIKAGKICLIFMQNIAIENCKMCNEFRVISVVQGTVL